MMNEMSMSSAPHQYVRASRSKLHSTNYIRHEDRQSRQKGREPVSVPPSLAEQVPFARETAESHERCLRLWLLQT